LQQDFDRAIARLPKWMLLLAATGTIAASFLSGISAAGGYLMGSLASYLNLRVIERAVNRIARLASGGGEKPGRGIRARVFIQFSGLILASLVILNVSGFNRAAAFCGLFVCPAAVLLEIVYELITLKR
jgi:hypothetical protein